TSIFGNARLDLTFRNDLAARPRHIDPAAELVEPLCDRADPFRLLLAFIETPRVEQRLAGIEQTRPDELGRPDFRDAPRIAADRIEVIVGDVVLEPAPHAGRWRADYGRRKLLEPGERGAVVVGKSIAFRGSRKQRLKRPRG